MSGFVAFHIETSHLICSANQMTNFFMKCNAGLKWTQTKDDNTEKISLLRHN